MECGTTKKNQISAIPVIPTVCENCCYSVYYERERGFSEIPVSLKKPNPRKRNNDKVLRELLFFLYYERERVSVEINAIKKNQILANSITTWVSSNCCHSIYYERE